LREAKEKKEREREREREKEKEKDGDKTARGTSSRAAREKSGIKTLSRQNLQTKKELDDKAAQVFVQ